MMKEPVPEWAQQLMSQLSELEMLIFDVPHLREKTISNGNELHKINKTISAIKSNTMLVPQVLEVTIANYTIYDKLSKRVEKLENPDTD